MNSAKEVVFLCFDDMGLLDLSGPLSVFWAAGVCSKDRKIPGYSTHLVSVDGLPVRTAEGAIMQTEAAALYRDMEIDTIVIPGAMDISPIVAAGHVTAALKELLPNTKRVASVCSGAFLLGDAGLLVDKRAVTHWAMCDELSAKHPDVQVEPDSIFVHDGNIWTSAGVSAGIDLALALVEKDYGRDTAIEVARRLVVYMRRPGGQSQFSQMLNSQASQSTTFDKLHIWLQDNLAEPGLNVEMLATRAGMSPRNFARVYKTTTSRTPAKAIELFRLEAARQQLEETDEPIDVVARRCGFSDEEQMRVVFHRNLAVAPRDYRSRFASPLNFSQLA